MAHMRSRPAHNIPITPIPTSPAAAAAPPRPGPTAPATVDETGLRARAVVRGGAVVGQSAVQGSALTKGIGALWPVAVAPTGSKTGLCTGRLGMGVALACRGLRTSAILPRFLGQLYILFFFCPCHSSFLHLPSLSYY